jgi:SIR2-like domain
MITWPAQLIDELARRRSIIFLGSGVSKNSIGTAGKRPPLWKEFLEIGVKRCEPAKRRKEISKLIKDSDLLTACELLHDALGADWEALILEEFINPQYKSSPIHSHIFGLDSRLVITQNFDKIYDTYASAASQGTVIVKSYAEGDVSNFIRKRQRLVIKAHGSIDAPNDMVFTKGDYARARHRHVAFYALLDGLMLTHTCLFLGCGINDPDIQVLLERNVQLHPTSNPHYIAMGSNFSLDFKRALKKTMNLELLQYNPKDDHIELQSSLERLVEMVDLRKQDLSKNLDW